MKGMINANLATVKVDKLRLRAYIGFVDWEKEKLQDLEIDYSFKYDMQNAATTDDVRHAINYKTLNKEIIQLVENESFHLIEAVAEKVFLLIQNYDSAVQEIHVQVAKPHALRFSDSVMIQIQSSDRFNDVIIALGSNIHPHKNVKKAVKYLRKIGFIVQQTEFIKTKPLKFEDQEDFLNGAVLVQTSLSLYQLRMHLKQIEVLMGRVRGKNKNQARQIDLDILTFNGHLIDTDIDELPFLKTFVNDLLGLSVPK